MHALRCMCLLVIYNSWRICLFGLFIVIMALSDKMLLRACMCGRKKKGFTQGSTESRSQMIRCEQLTLTALKCVNAQFRMPSAYPCTATLLYGYDLGTRVWADPLAP